VLRGRGGRFAFAEMLGDAACKRQAGKGERSSGPVFRFHLLESLEVVSASGSELRISSSLETTYGRRC